MRSSKGITTVMAAFGILFWTACGGGQSGETQNAQATANPCAANPCAANPCDMQQGQMAEGVTAELVNQGAEIYAGAGLCYACHGQDAKGMPGLGANLIDGEWLHSDGSLDALTNTVMNGVSAEESSSGTPMPPRGGSGITDDQVKAVSAYVYSLSHSDS